MIFQSTLPLRGATLIFARRCRPRKFQSTLPLRGATKMWDNRKCQFGFQSTLPLRGATETKKGGKIMRYISIHAPLTGSDCFVVDEAARTCDFNPRSPYGERRLYRGGVRIFFNFNPRSPYGERLAMARFTPVANDFNPRSPYGERQILMLNQPL